MRNNFRQLAASISRKKTYVLSVLAIGMLPALPSANAQAQGGNLSSLAEREIARRANLVVEADKALTRGRTAYAKNQYEEAVKQYRIAVNLLPPGPAIADRRASYNEHLGDAAVALAQEYRRIGKTEEARNLLDGLLSQDPTNLVANKQLEYLDDPIRTNPALTFDHTVDIDRVRKHLYRGEGHYNLGKYDEADSEFKEVLRIDPYNKAARRWLEKIAATKSDYYRAAFDQTRAELLKEVDKAWETAVPPDLPDFSGDRNDGTASQTSGVQYLQQKLNNIMLPFVEFEDVTVQECIETLRLRAREFDKFETDESKKGINIMMRDSGLTSQDGDVGADALDGGAGGGFVETSDIGSRRIDELRLTNVPLGQLLTYICNKTRLRYVLDDYTVTLLPVEAADTDVLYPRNFTVPPDFISRLTQGSTGGGVADDPFAEDGGGNSALGERASAETLLKDSGVSFPEGAFANFIASSSTLVVYNTLNNLDLIEEIVAVLRRGGPRQVRIMTKFIEISQENTDELGFDWIVTPFTLYGDRGDTGFISGGTTGNGSARSLSDLGDPSILPDGSSSVTNIVTSGLRSGDFANSRNSIDAIINNPERSGQATNVAPGIFSLTGLFDNGEAQMIMRGLQQKKGVDVMTAPSILARSGDAATIEVIREFIYPTEYEPPELPQSIGGGIGGDGGDGGGSVEIFPVTPATPTGFEVRNTGVTLNIEPTIAEDNYAIDLRFKPELTEFEGFINYGSPIQTLASDLVGNPVSLTITENRIEQPIFSTRRVETSLTIYDGYTVSVGGLMREDVQNVEDSVPILGDLPIIGRLFQSKAENRIKSNLVIFVTAEIIDAAGARLNQTGPAPEDLPPADLGLGSGGLLPDR